MDEADGTDKPDGARPKPRWSGFRWGVVGASLLTVLVAVGIPVQAWWHDRSYVVFTAECRLVPPR